MTVYFPKSVFNGATGQKSIDYGGAEAIKADLQRLMIMFDPKLKHSDCADGGIALGNMQDGFIEDLYDALIAIPDGFFGKFLQHILRTANDLTYEALTGRNGVHGLRIVDTQQGNVTFEWYDTSEPDARNRWKLVPSYIVENVAGWLNIFINVLSSDNFWTSPKVIEPQSENTLATAKSVFTLWSKIKDFFSHLLGQGNPQADGDINQFISNNTISWDKIIQINNMINWNLINVPNGSIPWDKIIQINNMINWNLINVPDGAIPWTKIDWTGYTLPPAIMTALQNIVNKVNGGGTVNANGSITWGSGADEKIGVGNMNFDFYTPTHRWAHFDSSSDTEADVRGEL